MRGLIGTREFPERSVWVAGCGMREHRVDDCHGWNTACDTTSRSHIHILCGVPPTYSCGPLVSSIQLSKDMFKMKDTTIVYEGVVVQIWSPGIGILIFKTL